MRKRACRTPNRNDVSLTFVVSKRRLIHQRARMPSDPESKFCVTSRTIRPTDSDRGDQKSHRHDRWGTNTTRRTSAKTSSVTVVVPRHSRRIATISYLRLLRAISRSRRRTTHPRRKPYVSRVNRIDEKRNSSTTESPMFHFVSLRALRASSRQRNGIRFSFCIESSRKWSKVPDYYENGRELVARQRRVEIENA